MATSLALLGKYSFNWFSFLVFVLKNREANNLTIMTKTKILMVNPVRQKSLKERALPLGYYIVSTVLSNNGFDVKCLDLTFSKDWKKDVSKQINIFCPQIIGFSVCGASNYEFALDIINTLRLHKHNIPLIFGGQHMQEPTTLSTKFYYSITGYIENLNELHGHKIQSSRLESIDFSIITNHLKYFPVIEISRGCWNRCRFCNASNFHIEKPTEYIEKELNKLANIYPQNTVLSLGGSNHVFSKWGKRGLLTLLKDFSKHFRYNFNLGVESGWDSVWNEIVELDPWNIFVGIESINKSALLNMRKTKTPNNYIKKASDLLKRCASDNLYAFVTYIYGYPGDTIYDLDNLDNFIESHGNKCIVQLGEPCQAYPGTELLRNREFYEKMGVVFNKAWQGRSSAFYNLDISKELKFEYLHDRSIDVFRNVNNSKYSLYRCSGFRHFENYELFLKNIENYTHYRYSYLSKRTKV